MVTAEDTDKRKLLQFCKQELAKLCRQHNLATNGTKTDMVNRLLKPKDTKSLRTAKKAARKKKQDKEKKRVKKLKKKHLNQWQYVLYGFIRMEYKENEPILIPLDIIGIIKLYNEFMVIYGIDDGETNKICQ